MNKYYTIEEMTTFLEDIDPLCVEFEKTEGIIDSIHARLTAQQDHIEWQRGRLALAEHVIGELYLMQKEYES
jgi:hypothetical protein